MEFFDSTKSIIENIFYLCAPLAFIIALLGLYQIKVAKDSIKINSRRNSMAFSFQISEDYIPKMIESCDSLVDKLTALNIDYRTFQYEKIRDFRNLEEEHFDKEQFKLLKENYSNLDTDFHSLIEKLESFSLPFICGLADEELGYNIDSLKFVEFFQICSPFFHFNRLELNDDNLIYKNSSELYLQWLNRTEKDKLEQKMQKLAQEHKRKKVKKIKSVGT